MKRSKYTYRLEYGDSVYFLNGLSQQFFKVGTEKADNVDYLLTHADECKEVLPTFYQKMTDGLFITNSAEDEANVLLQKYNAVKQPHLFRLMVLPTYQCNLRCWYCTQNHEDLFISRETVNRIKSLIKKIMDDDEIKNFILSWFGGEPILCYDTVVELTTYAKNECEKAGKNFGCDITTNSTLLDHARINELIALGVNSFQITIDGTKEVHDKIKRLEKGSAYEKALENIEIIALAGVSCNVRFNYTKKNLNPEGIISDLKSHLSTEALKNCNFLLYKVWQEDSNCIPQKDVDRLFSGVKELGMRPRFSILDLCYADFKNFCSIFPNGKLAKCDNLDPENLTSEILEDGTIQWSDQITQVQEIKPEDGSFCAECKYYPMCWGPCQGRRQRLGKLDKCPFDEKYMNDMLINYCRNIDSYKKETI